VKEACVTKDIENDDFFLFLKEEDFSLNCVLNPDSRREKEKEKAFCLSLFLFAKPLHKINRVVVV
jgi:hypothetical protein